MTPVEIALTLLLVPVIVLGAPIIYYWLSLFLDWIMAQFQAAQQWLYDHLT